MRRRGLKPGEPLPRELGLFDGTGIPFPVQKRESWIELRRWLDDDEEVLSFFFPEFPNDYPGLETRILKADLALLREQPWSPQKGVDAILSDWPEDEPTRPCTPEDDERRLEAACDRFLEAVEGKHDA